MMKATQLPLIPEIMPPVLPAKYYAWFKIANAHPNTFWKRRWWFPFKEKFLAKYGERDGYDLQLFECHRCEGMGCGRCDDSGIYRKVYLERWLLPNGDLYHRPSSFVGIAGEQPKLTLKGLIKHGNQSDTASLRAALRLFFRFNRPRFYALIFESFDHYFTSPYCRRPWVGVKWKIRNRWLKISNLLPNRREDEIPF